MVRIGRGGTLRRREAVLAGVSLLAGGLGALKPAAAQGSGAPGDQAREISIGVASAVTSIDPHFHNLSSNFNIDINLFDRLIHMDERQQPQPGLATAWKALDDTTWEFTLRQGVVFHDGKPFGAEDVAASIRRVAWVPNSPGSFLVYTRAITGIEVVDDHTIRFRTEGPTPLLPVDLSSVMIVPRALEHAPTADFNSGVAAVGTGPYSFVEYVPNNRVTLRRNDRYWGPKPAWEKATIRMIPVNASRVAALLAGDVQAIDSVPPSDAPQLRKNAQLSVVSTRSNAVQFLHLDSFRAQTPGVTARDGSPLPRNPLQDLRVRKAISHAINRDALVRNIMEGAAAPAGQLLADGFFGVSPRLKPDSYDPAMAKKLLTEAGYADGFAMTLYAPNDRYINGAKVAQAVGQMLGRVGIETKVETPPWSVFIAQASAPNYNYSAFLIGNSSTTGEASFPLRSQVGTVDFKTGMGSSNRSRYSNPQVDAVLAEAMRTVDDAKRSALLQKTAEIAMADQAVVPLLYTDNVYALRKGLHYAPRSDGYLAAAMVQPQ
ncbi:ABC transporter substrate-binding protein [Roseomonas elaeocarpi]|uniref:ABC transporter substrate-binding protein n=1 Tax=Roseomonas elaeocarpi TaxID=907779 RepID=A0ABV6JWB4_9PROT